MTNDNFSTRSRLNSRTQLINSKIIQMTLSKKPIIYLATLLLFAFYTTSYSQSIWLNDKSDFVALEFAKPKISGLEDVKIFSGSYNLSFGRHIGKKTMFLAEVPIAYFNHDDIESDNSIGNIYVGLRLGKEQSNKSFDVGVILPTVSDSENLGFSGQYGVYSDLYRLESYAPDSWGLKFNYRSEKEFGEMGAYYKFRVGSLFLNVKDESRNENTSLLTLDYSGQVGIKVENGLNFMGGISGRAELTDEKLFGDRRNALFLGLMISYRKNNFEPGISLRSPLDKSYNEVLENILAFSLLFHLGN
jgi:hypothetical protein